MPQPPGLRSRWAALAWLALALAPAVVYLAAGLRATGGGLALPLDDGWIHLQFARNLARGAGLAYNPGAAVAGSTAPLWTALLSLAFLLPGDPLAWVLALGALCHLLAVAGTYRLARELGLGSLASGVGAALVATTSALVWGSLSGMEIPLFTALSTWGTALHVRERRRGEGAVSLALLGLAILARPEGALLAGLAIADRAIALGRDGDALRLVPVRSRSLAWGVALIALAVAPVLLAYHRLGGSVLPTTFATKAGYSTPGLPRSQYLFEVAGVLAAAQPVAVWLAPAGALLLLVRLGTPRDRGLLPALWPLCLPLAYGVLSGPGRGIFGNFGRYFYPLLPVVVVLAVLAAAAVLERLPPRLVLGPLRLTWPVWVGVPLLVPGLVAGAGGGARYAQNLRDVEAGDVRLARALAPLLPPAATLGVDDIGAFKYFLPNAVVDLAGIVSPQVHAYARRSLAATGSFCPGLLDFVRATRPDYLAIFPARHACFSDREFPLLLRLEVPGNITLGEGTIVLRATPWTRYPLRRPGTASPPPGTAPSRRQP